MNSLPYNDAKKSWFAKPLFFIETKRKEFFILGINLIYSERLAFFIYTICMSLLSFLTCSL